MSNIKIAITSSSYRRFWYDDLVGTTWRLIRDIPEEKCWLVSAKGGYTNIVRYSDGIELKG
jgi:hypothetical protein